MSLQTGGMVDAHAADDKLAARLERMDVVSDSDSHRVAVSCSRISASTTSRSSGVVHEDVIALTQRRKPHPYRVLTALTSRLHDHRLPGMYRLDLPLGALEAARRSDDDDPIDLVQGQEELEHARERGAPVQPDQRLAAAAEPGPGARGGDDRAHRRHRYGDSSRVFTRAACLRVSVPEGSAKIMRPAEVCITEVTTAVIVWLSRRRPF